MEATQKFERISRNAKTEKSTEYSQFDWTRNGQYYTDLDEAINDAADIQTEFFDTIFGVINTENGKIEYVTTNDDDLADLKIQVQG